MEPTIFLGTTNHPNIFNEITKSCEKLITETQSDIEIFRNEQQHLHQKIIEIIEENRCIHSKLEVLKSAMTSNGAGILCDSIDDASREKLTNDAIKNLKQQIDYLQRENHDLRLLNETNKNTIENLEKEISDYRNQLYTPTSVFEVKQKYTTTIKLLESTISNLQLELKEQSQVIEHLFEEKKHFSDHIENLQKSIEENDKNIVKQQEITETITKLQEQLAKAEHLNKELQKSLKISQHAIEERIKREQSALQKLNEALTMVEVAVTEKEEALKRERVVKEECDNIASTIGQVMDEAARKVEKDMETIRKKFVDKEKELTDEKNKLFEEIQNQKKYNQILDSRCQRFDQKLNDAIKNNENLSLQLEVAAKALLEKEEQFNKQEATVQKRFGDQEREIHYYVENNKQLKEKYRMALEELTNGFGHEIYHLQKEVSNLKAENRDLKLQN